MGKTVDQVAHTQRIEVDKIVRLMLECRWISSGHYGGWRASGSLHDRWRNSLASSLIGGTPDHRGH